MAQKKNKVLVVGWDSADWKMIDKLMAKGLMPAIKSVIDNGVRGKIATLDPPLSPMLWTSMATGVRPFKHGVLGFVEHDGAGGVRPVSSHSRKVKAIWNMLSIEGYKSNVVGWWPSNPVESINGCMVSNLYQQEKEGKETIKLEDWKIQEGQVYPERIIDKIKDLRIHPSEISGNLVMPFVPQAIQLDKKQDKRLTIISKFLAHASTVHATATELMETEPWDFMAVYHDALDHFSHGFMKYHPPRMEGLDEEAFNLFKEVVTGAYVYHDMMLGRLLGMIDEDTTVIVVSDHGFHSDHLRPTHVPNVPSGPAVEHAPFGVFVAKGPGIKKGERIYGANILDLTPTLLTLFDLPIGKDMDGKPLLDIYEYPKQVKYIDSWENVDGSGGELIMKSKGDAESTKAALQQLVDLGYIEDLDYDNESNDPTESLKTILKENNFYLAKSYSSAGKYDEALELLLEIESKDKPDFRYLIEIIQCAIKTKRFALADEYLNFSRKQKVLSETYSNVLDAKIQIGLNRPERALILLEKARKQEPESAEILLELGKFLNSLNKFKEARRCFKKMIAHDPDNAYAYHGIGLSYLRDEKYELALDNFLNAIDRTFHYPLAHVHLGETLALMKEYDHAIGTFELAKTMVPDFPKTYRWLKDLYEIKGDKVNAEKYDKILKSMTIGEKIILTGPPGKKMLEAIELLKSKGVELGGPTDDLEGKNFTVLQKDWFKNIKEKVCYIPIQMVVSLNAKHTYRFIYIEDDSEEVALFINKQKSFKDDSLDLDLIDAINNSVRIAKVWFGQQPDLDMLSISDLSYLDKLFNGKEIRVFY